MAKGLYIVIVMAMNLERSLLIQDDGMLYIVSENGTLLEKNVYCVNWFYHCLKELGFVLLKKLVTIESFDDIKGLEVSNAI